MAAMALSSDLSALTYRGVIEVLAFFLHDSPGSEDDNIAWQMSTFSCTRDTKTIRII